MEIREFKCQEFGGYTFCFYSLEILDQHQLISGIPFRYYIHLFRIQLDITDEVKISLVWLEVKKRKLDDVEIIGALRRWKWQMLLLSNQQCKANEVY